MQQQQQMLFVFVFLFSIIFGIASTDEKVQTIEKHRIKDKFIFKTINVTSSFECFYKYPKEIASIIELIHVNVIDFNKVLCRYSFVKLQYWRMFPNRYLEETNSTNGIDRVYAALYKNKNLLQFSKPMMFYPLDDLSIARNEGTLSDQNTYQISYKPYPPTFTCSYKNNQRKYLQMIPSVVPRYEIFYNNSNLIQAPVTFMIWVKQTEDNQRGPLFEGNFQNYAFTSWAIWTNYIPFVRETQFMTHFGGSITHLLVSKTPTVYWTHLAFVVDGKQTLSYINGTLTQKTSLKFSLEPSHTISIGRRYKTTNDSYNGLTFDGCLAHMAIFNYSLSQQEILNFMSMFDENSF